MTAAAGLGPRLRAERERQGLGVQKVADDLRLDAWVIEALEADDFERVGAPVYAKGHLRKYATLLGLPEEDLAATLETLTVATAAPSLAESSARLAASPRLGAGLPWRQAATVLVLTAVIAGVLWWKPWRIHLAPGSPHPAAPAVPAVRPAARPAEPAARPGGAPVGAPAPRTSTPMGSAPPTVRAAPPVRAAPAPAASPVSGGELRLALSADSWVFVRDGAGRTLYGGIARAGANLRLAGRPPFTVILGYAAGVRVAFGGRPLAIGARYMRGNVARFVVGGDGTLTASKGSARPPR